MTQVPKVEGSSAPSHREKGVQSTVLAHSDCCPSCATPSRTGRVWWSNGCVGVQILFP